MGYVIQSAGAVSEQVLEYYGGRISTHSFDPSGQNLFNFYEVTD